MMGRGVFAPALCQGKPKLRSIGGETGAADACGLRSGWGNLVISFLLLLFFYNSVRASGYILGRVARGRVGSDLAVGWVWIGWCAVGMGWALAGKAGL